MNTLIVDYDPFVKESSSVSLYNEDGIEEILTCSTIVDLAEALVTLAYANNAFNVKVHGPFAIASEIRRNINFIESGKYSKNTIIVEGI